MASELETASDDAAARRIDIRDVPSIYANYCRVTGLAEEVVIDFGLSADSSEMARDAVKTNERVIVSFFTAKRLLDALQVTVNRHESAFGSVETNVEKRFVPGWQR
jgi:hypothetical protein